MLQAKNEAAAFAEQKQDSSCQALKGKNGTDQLLHYQHLRDKKLRQVSANQEWVDAAGGKKLLLNFIRQMDCQRAS